MFPLRLTLIYFEVKVLQKKQNNKIIRDYFYKKNTKWLLFNFKIPTIIAENLMLNLYPIQKMI